MINIETIAAFLFIFARMSGCIFFNPMLGRRNIPAIIKVSLVLVLTIVMAEFSNTPVPKVDTVIEYIVILALELAFGFVLGFIVSLFTSILILGGELIDFQIGISMSKIYDVQSNISMALSSTFYNILFIFIFFSVNGHLTLIRYFLVSDQIVPFGQVVLNGELSVAIIDLFCQTIILSIKLAMPILAIEFLFEMAVGIIMKIIPQINVFVINIQLKLFIGLISLYIFLIPAANLLESFVNQMFEALKQAMGLMK